MQTGVKPNKKWESLDRPRFISRGERANDIRSEVIRRFTRNATSGLSFPSGVYLLYSVQSVLVHSTEYKRSGLQDDISGCLIIERIEFLRSVNITPIYTE